MTRRYSRGLHDLGNGVFAYLQPDGSWGWNNAGLVVSDGKSLLVDTLWDLALTRQMLEAMIQAAPEARQIQTVVNTHANGDHCWGNQLVTGAEIIASRRGAEEMQELPPNKLAMMMKAARLFTRLGPAASGIGWVARALGAGTLAALTEGADYVTSIFGAFQFEGITLTPPTRTFDGELELRVGSEAVRLIEVGPAHTQGDVLVYLPERKVLFSGDILFIEGHPVMWAGPVERWIAACDRILGLELETIVPGHGPLTDKAGVQRLKEYLEMLHREARKRFDAGMDPMAAALDISLDAYSSWKDAERIVVNVETLYREFRGQTGGKPDAAVLFGKMARWKRSRETT